MKFDRIIVTCEHAGNRVPARFKKLFNGQRKILDTHEGIDIGALDAARHLSRVLKAPLHSQNFTRLLIEGNRSLGSKSLFSRFSSDLSDGDKRLLLNEIYFPFRIPVESQIRSWLRQKKTVLHLSVHTFTPVWRGKVRRVDVAFLHDSTKKKENVLRDFWRSAVKKLRPGFRMPTNKPYSGMWDGFGQSLRDRFNNPRLVVMEIEINQCFPIAGGREWATLKRDLGTTLLATLEK